MATFGKTTIGATEWYFSAGAIVGSKFNLPENSKVSKISVYQYFGLSCKCAIYDVNGNLMGQTEQVYYEGPGAWVDYIFLTPLLLPAGDYYLCFWNTKDVLVYFDAGLANQTLQKSLPYTGVFPDPIGTIDAYFDLQLSIYATYTPVGVTHVLSIQSTPVTGVPITVNRTPVGNTPTSIAVSDGATPTIEAPPEITV